MITVGGYLAYQQLGSTLSLLFTKDHSRCYETRRGYDPLSIILIRPGGIPVVQYTHTHLAVNPLRAGWTVSDNIIISTA